MQVRISDVIAPAYRSVHADIRDGVHSEYWLKGGRGSAKSSFISLEIVLGLLRDPEANAIIYRRVAATLRESVYAQMAWAIERLGLGDMFAFGLAPLEIVLKPTGQRIMFRGADDPAKSKSIKLAKGYFGFLWFEELAEFESMQAVRTIKASIIRGSGRAITLYSYNPPRSQRSWVNREARTRRSGRLVHHSSYLDVPREWLGEGFIAEAEQLRQENSAAYRHMYMGEETGNGGKVFENLQLRAIPDAEIATFGATYAGIDFGWYPDPLHFVRCAYDMRRRRLWVYDEYCAVRVTNGDAAQVLLHEKRVTMAEEVIGDSADPKAIADMRAAGIRCAGAIKGPGSVLAGIRWLQGLNAIVIDPERCPAAAREFLEYEYERDAAGRVVQSYPDRDNHSIDAVRYAMNRVWQRGGQ